MGSLTYGSGAYSNAQGVVSSDNIDGGMGSDVPIFSNGPNTITVSHREYVSDVYAPNSAAVFSNQTYSLNPGLVQTFPWLAQVAGNYEEYTFKQLIWTFKSNVTDFVSSNGQVGTVTMAVQYNANDQPFPTKQDAMEYDGAVSGKVSEKAILCGVECDPAQNSGSAGKYCRPGPVAAGEDIKTFDLGTLNFMVSNTPPQFNNQALGELWVSYTVELRKPKFLATRGLAIQRDVFVGEQPGSSPVMIHQLSIGEGQQNRIQGKLYTKYRGNGTETAYQYPAQNNVLYYVLPSSFSGDIELKGIVSGLQDAARTVLEIVPTTGVPAYPSPGWLPLAAVQPNKDIWTQDGWVNYVLMPGATTANSNDFFSHASVTAHYRVIPPTTAASPTENVFSIIMTPASDGSGVTALYLDISIYNTGLNNMAGGQPVIMNPSTEIVESWP